MAVVARDRVARPARVEQLVPVHGGEAPAELELAACIEDLDARDGVGQLERPGVRAGPVRMREVGDAALGGDPLRRGGEVAALALELRQRVLDPEGEHMAVPVAREQAVQLRARDHDDALRRRWRTAKPVVGDREDVVARSLVVLDERPRGELAVGIRRVGMQRAAQPRPLPSPGVFHRIAVLCRTFMRR